MKVQLEFDVTIELTLTEKEFDFLDKYMQHQGKNRWEYREAVEQGGFWFGNCNSFKFSAKPEEAFLRFKTRDINGPVLKALEWAAMVQEDREQAYELSDKFTRVWRLASEKCRDVNTESKIIEI